MILDYNASRPEDKRIAGFVFTSTKKKEALRESIDAVTRYGVPALYVPDDTHSADKKVYDCIKNTKLQAYEEKKRPDSRSLRPALSYRGFHPRL